MKHIKSGATYILRLDRGERIVETLTRFCEKRKVRAGYFFGIGTCRRAELGFFRMGHKRYSFRTFPGEYEIASLQGNVSLRNGSAFVHAHIVISGPDFLARGGHLKEAEVLATCEIALSLFSRPLARTLSRSSGLNLLAI
jgi:predicted DNA-binding protein with PD1-like motif